MVLCYLLIRLPWRKRPIWFLMVPPSKSLVFIPLMLPNYGNTIMQLYMCMWCSGPSLTAYSGIIITHLESDLWKLSDKWENPCHEPSNNIHNFTHSIIFVSIVFILFIEVELLEVPFTSTNEIRLGIGNHTLLARGIATHPCHNFNGGLTKPPIMLGHILVTTHAEKPRLWLLILALIISCKPCE